jgi:hypothetical protein
MLELRRDQMERRGKTAEVPAVSKADGSRVQVALQRLRSRTDKRARGPLRSMQGVPAMTTIASPTKPLSPLAQFRRRLEAVRITKVETDRA